ncbi:hypothetical protein [Pseudomonas sichuanensis]|uniref:hypothetical protein n=1 Tax=Pseudomonas sichuanensis TaxID=2213015 RepID=UPI00215F639B|nr:hypothetical protein [Pseudomonas sichuanensis]UVL86856.1 hypothetical protein LOY51_13650 [Pseudomonas sichuanensis]
MARTRSLTLMLAFCLAIASASSFAASTTYGSGTEPQKVEHSTGDQPRGSTAGDGSSVNNPGGGKGNDSSDTGTNADAADGAAGGSNSTGEATGSGAGHTGGTAEDQDSH